MKLFRTLILVALMVGFMPTTSHAGHSWLIYHKPEFKGKVVDAETREPIEGAVVVVRYLKYPLIGGPGGRSASVLNVREALTDKNGFFRIPSYTALIPFSVEYKAVFVVFKPGYASISDMSLEENFSNRIYGKEVEYPWLGNRDLKFVFGNGYVGLPKVRATGERRLARTDADISGVEIKEIELPLLYKLINEEKKNGF